MKRVLIALIAVLAVVGISSCGGAKTIETADHTVIVQYQNWISDFVNLAGNISTAGDDYEAAATYMDRMTDLAQLGKTLPKTGIPAIDDEWSSCMDDLIKGASLGAQGVREMDVAKLTTAMDYVSQANDHLTSMSSELQ